MKLTQGAIGMLGDLHGSVSVERRISMSDELGFQGVAKGHRIVIHLRRGGGIQAVEGWSGIQTGRNAL